MKQSLLPIDPRDALPRIILGAGVWLTACATGALAGFWWGVLFLGFILMAWGIVESVERAISKL